MQIQTCFYILTQTLLVVKFKPLTDEILRLMMCKTTSAEFAHYLNEKDLYKPFLYSEKFQHKHTCKYSKVEIGVGFAYRSQEMFENYLVYWRRLQTDKLADIKNAQSDYESSLTPEERETIARE
jgi:hypothetical protein